MHIYNRTAYNPNLNARHRAQVLNDRILHFTITQLATERTEMKILQCDNKHIFLRIRF